MPKNNTWGTNLLKLLFQNIGSAKIGDATGLVPSTGTGNLYISLHTADPGVGGLQTTNEAAYTSYARVAVVRSAGGWTVSGTNPEQVTNVAAISFPKATGGSETETFFGIGTDATLGAGYLLYSGALVSSLAVSNNITPNFAIGGLIVTEA